MLKEVLSELLLETPDLAKFGKPENLPWENLLPLAHHHQLAPRLYRTLGAEARATLPAPIFQSLRDAVLSASHTHAIYGNFAPKIIGLMRAHGIAVLVLKGMVLARRFYPEPSERPFMDLDLLFHPSDRQRVEEILSRNGYERDTEDSTFEANAHKTKFTFTESPAIQVECHFGLGHGRYALDGFWDRARCFALEGFAFPVRHLDPCDEVLFLIYHAAVQHRFQKLGWLLDLAQIARLAPPGPKELRARALESGLVPALDLTTYFLARYAGIDGGKAVTPRPSLDQWFERIAVGSIEKSAFRRAQLRALTQGSWIAVARYAAQRQWALLQK